MLCVDHPDTAMCRMPTPLFAHSGFINTAIFQFLVIVACGLLLLPATAVNFLMDWNFLDAFEDVFYSGWSWFFSLLFWIGLLWYLNTKLVSKWWNETIE